MQYTVTPIEWNGEVGARAQFDVMVVKECDPSTIYPVPTPLFGTKEEAQAYADDPANLQAYVQGELTRLSDATDDNYRQQRGLKEKHAFLKGMLPAPPPPAKSSSSKSADKG